MYTSCKCWPEHSGAAVSMDPVSRLHQQSKLPFSPDQWSVSVVQVGSQAGLHWPSWHLLAAQDKLPLRTETHVSQVWQTSLVSA